MPKGSVAHLIEKYENITRNSPSTKVINSVKKPNDLKPNNTHNTNNQNTTKTILSESFKTSVKQFKNIEEFENSIPEWDAHTPENSLNPDTPLKSKSSIADLICETPETPLSVKQDFLFSPKEQEFFDSYGSEGEDDIDEICEQFQTPCKTNSNNTLFQLQTNSSSTAKSNLTLTTTNSASSKPLMFSNSDTLISSTDEPILKPGFLEFKNASKEVEDQLIDSIVHDIINDRLILKGTQNNRFLDTYIHFSKENHLKFTYRSGSIDDIDKDDIWEEDIWKTNSFNSHKEKLTCILETKEPIEASVYMLKDQDKLWNNLYSSFDMSFLLRPKNNILYEFPDLFKITQQKKFKSPEKQIIMDVGCGLGNALLPILSSNKNLDLQIFGIDISDKAIDIMQSSDHFKHFTNLTLKSFDITTFDISEKLPELIQQNSIDIIILTFTLSTIHPSLWSQLLKNLHYLLKPFGKILFRDHAFYDFNHVYLDTIISDNTNLRSYIKNDFTQSYYFKESELQSLFEANNFSTCNISIETREFKNSFLIDLDPLYKRNIQAVFISNPL
ncbi:hypothetical protein TBLA_0B03890 [Henningerozyma blattae CBS 6284]|uniref:Methyltransferase type 12 domain-containing protein n=1 Tax=Henningerozyma blattae (strain ATCC 34711 / CBS 6284 / DSM 70876 / NBRC 10599 / NRRL Y-10934 / UCD 77-7) TaxID=1071380 RepID=I2GYM5_HENB6|nr:hypothetical protein TBLA_0B03890 [Tetrapisispora blattae CBS 6284]CCH59227.1 hypothetical protein TBLA_0B03890 [Tetrapisispora blattae CBS 6284]